jgi:exodeoxyribonuclease VII large subunit
MRRIRSNQPLSLFAQREALSVTELTEEIKDALESGFHDLYVQGEISNYKRAASGHLYFTLKDDLAQVRATFYRQWNRLLRFEPENGLEVKVRGRLGVYEPRGEYQIMVELMEPVGIGALQLAFEQQLRRLQAEGLFDEARKRKLPPFPRRIAVVTSPAGAVIRDILNILARRNPSIDVVIAPVRVQGAGAGVEIANAIKILNERAKEPGNEIDVIVVARGGGSAEDLAAFNEEQVARAIFASEIPVVSAVGHETDFTVADFVADLRAPTPSAAAEIIAADVTELQARVGELVAALERSMNYYLLQRRSHLRDLTESRSFTDTANTVLRLSNRVRELESRAATALKARLHRAQLRVEKSSARLVATDLRVPMTRARAKLEASEKRLHQTLDDLIARRRHQLAVTASKLDMLSPLAVLSRGYAIVLDESKHLIPRGAPLKPGQKVSVRFEDGEVGCEVTETLKPLRQS